MKHIFVTLAEFVDNGGILKKNRAIFDSGETTSPRQIGSYLKWDKNQNCPLMYSSNWKSFPACMELHRVKIKVTPSWK